MHLTAHVAIPPSAADLPDGGRVVMRAADDADVGEIMAMHARCSQATLLARYFTAARPPSRRLCRALVRTELALVAVTSSGSVVALGNVARADEDPVVGEVAVLVEDAWQSRGLGTALLRHLVGTARLRGFREIVAVAPHRGTWTEAALARLGPPLLQRTPFGEAVIRVSLAPHHRGLVARPAVVLPRQAVSRSGPEPDP